MDIACNIGFTDGTHLALDGYDIITFFNEVPEVEEYYTGYNLQQKEDVYYRVLNNLKTYPFVGIKRKDNSDRLEFAGKVYAFKNYYNDGEDIIEENDTLYLQTSAITTIAVYEQCGSATLN